MTDFIYNRAKGSFVEFFRDAPNAGILALMIAQEAEDAQKDHDTLSALFGAAGNTEATDGTAARKTGLTGTITQDNTNNRTDVDFPDQTFTGLAGADVVAVLIAHEESASEAGRIPCAHLDATINPDGNDVTIQLNASGWGRAQDV